MVLGTIDAHAFFSYDSAASLMEQGRWDEAKQQLQKLLVDKPDAPDILYDAGVASYQTKDYKQARAYFNRVTQLPQTKVELKEQAHFNAGNAAAALKEYENAIKQYEAVLNIDKNNEKAKHNIETIKALMQRKQEPQNKEKDSKKIKIKKKKNPQKSKKIERITKRETKKIVGNRKKKKIQAKIPKSKNSKKKGTKSNRALAQIKMIKGKKLRINKGSKQTRISKNKKVMKRHPAKKIQNNLLKILKPRKKIKGKREMLRREIKIICNRN